MLSKSDVPLEERAELCMKEKRFWRSLIRVNSVSYGEDKIGLVIPGWNIRDAVYFDLKQIPKGLLEEIERCAECNYRFFAPVNIGATKPDDLYIDISNYEKAN